MTERDAADLAEKERALRAALRGYGRVVVAFSGGVDSATLLAVARAELGEGARAVLAAGPSLPARDRADALAVAERLGAPLEIVETGEFADERYLRNDADRCYWCRFALGRALAPLARAAGAQLVYGPVADDLDEDRPGMRAAAEAGFRAPLLEAGFTKADVRELARRLGLGLAEKPSSACLASRVPTGERIDAGRLARIDEAEQAVRALGFRIVRVRDHGVAARIELGPEEIPALLDAATRAAVSAAVKKAGFRKVAVDLDGYRPAGLKERLPAR